MNPYLDALNAMHELLSALGEQHWRSWIAKDIDEWNHSRSVRHHLSAYGGMGSFNDIWFEEVWLGTVFEDLKSICYHFAHSPMAKPDARALERSMGNVGFELSGWRCLSCGYGVVSYRDINFFLARQIIRQRILVEAAHTRLQEFVRSVIEAPPKDAKLTNDNVARWIEASGLHVRNSNDWLRPCPGCGTDDTAVYRWLFAGEKFVPTHDNLPVNVK